MRLLVCGGRKYHDRVLVYSVLDDHLRRTRLSHKELVIIHGDSSGADHLARDWARSRKVPIIPFPAKWREGRRAGPIRNTLMLKEGRPRKIIAFPGGPGTADMVRQGLRAGVEVEQIGLAA